MGVDIHFSAEIRRQNKWQPLIWYNKPQERDKDESWSKPRIADNGLEVHDGMWGGRAYHYTDALEDMNYYSGYPKDMSDELRARLPDDIHVSSGYFMYSDLVKMLDKAEAKMLSDMLQSRDYQLIKHINRIEKAVLSKPQKDKISTSYLSDYSIKQIYEEYMEEMYRWIELRNIIYYFADEICPFMSSGDDIRIIYFMC